MGAAVSEEAERLPRASNHQRRGRRRRRQLHLHLHSAAAVVLCSRNATATATATASKGRAQPQAPPALQRNGPSSSTWALYGPFIHTDRAQEEETFIHILSPSSIDPIPIHGHAVASAFVAAAETPVPVASRRAPSRPLPHQGRPPRPARRHLHRSRSRRSLQPPQPPPQALLRVRPLCLCLW